jgi:hypothetical protein
MAIDERRRRPGGYAQCRAPVQHRIDRASVSNVFRVAMAWFAAHRSTVRPSDLPSQVKRDARKSRVELNVAKQICNLTLVR